MAKDVTSFPKNPGTRWTPALAGGGYTPVVNAFLDHASQRRDRGGLGLTPSQAMLVIQLMSFKRDVRMPYPAIKTLAQRLGQSYATVWNNLKVLERRKLLVKHPRRGDTPYYDLTGLFEKLEQLQAAANAKKQRERDRDAEERLPPAHRTRAVKAAT